jgi:hypothetical protein
MPSATAGKPSKAFALFDNTTGVDSVNPDTVDSAEFVNVRVGQRMFKPCVAEQSDNVFSAVLLDSQL